MAEVLRRHAFVAAAAFLFLAACSSSSGSLAPGQSSSLPSAVASRHLPSGGYRLIPGSAVEGSYVVPLAAHPWRLAHVWPAKKKHQQVMFVADPQDNQILMYNPTMPNPSPEGSITTGIDYPFGVAVDKKGTLYVANLLGGSPDIGSITIYPKGKTSPSLTITTGMDNPYGIAVDSKGNIFAANLGNGQVVAYAAGKSSPYETITFPSGSQPLGVGVDGKDNIWVGSDSNNSVYEIPKGSSTPQNAGLSGLAGTINVAFGSKDVMYVSNFATNNVQVYKYGTTSPSMTITDGIAGPTLSGFTTSDWYFQDNQELNVVGYKKNQSSPFSTITGIPDPRGIATTPLIKK
ncbi:MAG TPA: hypothetical protein VK755_13185 [Candidatus Acidoferrales bacterium]|nr:hypothetical protein [Candidatus Acidoferrales bacterium]